MDHYQSYEFEERPEEMGPVKRFFFACAGAYLRILEACPSEHTKYVGIGATIFLTACLAVISGSFAIYTLAESWWVAIPFGFLWGALIFNLDRYIVSSIRKEGKTWHEIGLAFPRMILAVLISVVITKPIEVELFHNQIDASLLSYTGQRERTARRDLDNKLGIDSLAMQLSRVDSLRIQYKKLRDGKPTSFDFGEVSKEYTKAKTTLDSLGNLYNPRIKANEARRNYLWNTYATKVYREDENGKKAFVKWNFPQKYQEQSTKLYNINKDLKEALATKQEVVRKLEKERRGAREEFTQNIEEELELLQIQRDELARALTDRQSIRETSLPGVQATAQRSGKGLPAKIQVLEMMKEEDSSIWWMSNLIVLLFIMLETSPVFVKLITKRGPYDYLLSRIEHHKKVESLRQISDMNYDLNATMQLKTRTNGVKMNGTKLGEEVLQE
ncbi:MAG: DUF4407 domain-containing protein [Bacteroidota bacterium]